MKEQTKELIMKRITNLFKIKSIMTLLFAGITIYAVVKATSLPEWLVPIITMCFKELYDKDKADNKEE